MNKIKRSQLLALYELLDEVQDFFITSLDFTDDEEYTQRLIDKIDTCRESIKDFN